MAPSWPRVKSRVKFLHLPVKSYHQPLNLGRYLGRYRRRPLPWVLPRALPRVLPRALPRAVLRALPRALPWALPRASGAFSPSTFLAADVQLQEPRAPPRALPQATSTFSATWGVKTSDAPRYSRALWAETRSDTAFSS